MDLLQKDDAAKIYALFCTKLNKIDAILLFGLYYSDVSNFRENEIEKFIIIGQQLLTYLKRNSFQVLEESDSISKLFYDKEDEIDKKCHPDFFINEEFEIDIDKIQNFTKEFNKQLSTPISFKFIPEQKDSPDEDAFEEQEKNEEKEPKEIVVQESDNAREAIEKFLSLYPSLSKKSQKRFQRSVLLLGIRNGSFISSFLRAYFKVFFIEEDEEKVKKIKSLKNNSQVSRYDGNYLDCPETACLDAVWSYTAIARMKKDEIIQALLNIEVGLIEGGYAFISFMYGSGHKTINGHYYTLMNEDSFRTIVAKARNLEIKNEWTKEYTRKDGSTAKRLNIILQKNTQETGNPYFESDTTEEYPQSIDVQKFQLVSRAKTMLQPEIETEVEQKITISKDGRIWITRSKLIGANGETEAFEKKIISIDKAIAEKIFFMVYRTLFLQEHVKVSDAGEWELTLTATNDDIYTATGTFGVSLLYNNKIDICKLVRESIPVEGLWVFDDL